MRKLTCPRLCAANTSLWLLFYECKALASLKGGLAGPDLSTDGHITAENENQEVMTSGPTFLRKGGSLKLTSYASQTPSGHMFFC